MRVASSDLNGFVFVKTASFEGQHAWRQFGIVVSLSQLPIQVPPPRIDPSQRRSSNSVSKAALDGIDSFASFFETGQHFRDVVGIGVAEA